VIVINYTNINKNEQSPLILTNLTEHKMSIAYNVGNPDPGLRQAHKCGRVKPVYGSMSA